MRTGRTILGVMAILLLGGCVTANSTHSNHSWHPVYSHDADGNALEGSKTDLMNAVRQGKPVRIYWRGRTVEHSTDAIFVTILGGEVFTQTPEIRGQAPSLDPPAIEFRENKWQGLFSTNGNRALRWYVQY